MCKRHTVHVDRPLGWGHVAVAVFLLSFGSTSCSQPKKKEKKRKKKSSHHLHSSSSSFSVFLRLPLVGRPAPRLAWCLCCCRRGFDGKVVRSEERDARRCSRSSCSLTTRWSRVLKPMSPFLISECVSCLFLFPLERGANKKTERS